MPRKPKPTQPATVIHKASAPQHFSGDRLTRLFGHNGFKADDKGAQR